MDTARGKGSGSGGRGRAGDESRIRVAARTNQQPKRAGGPLGLVKRKLKKVCASYGLSMLEYLRLETSELTCLVVIGRGLPADYQYADG